MTTKRRRGEKKIKSILAQPIEYDLDLPVVGAVGLNGELFNAVRHDIARQLQARFEAIYEHFSIPASESGAQSKLMMRMAIELFPSAFTFTRRGTKKKGKKWTTERLISLWELVQQLVAENPGMTIEGAAKRIKEGNLLTEMTPTTQSTTQQNLVQRYYEADQLMRRIRSGNASNFEWLDLAAHQEKLRKDLREELRSGVLADIEQVQPGIVARLLGLEPEELDEILRT
ncbi:hypothetical protein ACETIH_01250 [Microvirga arabica]|uniref:Uncharacterized protein n=1 Tax=Microvirga arabica TaxID=1128671 RepID=A0ABV6Y292_9HYPH